MTDKHFITMQARAALQAKELQHLAHSVYALRCWRCGRTRAFTDLAEVEQCLDRAAHTVLESRCAPQAIPRYFTHVQEIPKTTWSINELAPPIFPIAINPAHAPCSDRMSPVNRATRFTGGPL